MSWHHFKVLFYDLHTTLHSSWDVIFPFSIATHFTAFCPDSLEKHAHVISHNMPNLLFNIFTPNHRFRLVILLRSLDILCNVMCPDIIINHDPNNHDQSCKSWTQNRGGRDRSPRRSFNRRSRSRSPVRGNNRRSGGPGGDRRGGNFANKRSRDSPARER